MVGPIFKKKRKTYSERECIYYAGIHAFHSMIEHFWKRVKGWKIVFCIPSHFSHQLTNSIYTNNKLLKPIEKKETIILSYRSFFYYRFLVQIHWIWCVLYGWHSLYWLKKNFFTYFHATVVIDTFIDSYTHKHNYIRLFLLWNDIFYY